MGRQHTPAPGNDTIQPNVIPVEAFRDLNSHHIAVGHVYYIGSGESFGLSYSWVDVRRVLAAGAHHGPHASHRATLRPCTTHYRPKADDAGPRNYRAPDLPLHTCLGDARGTCAVEIVTRLHLPRMTSVRTAGTRDFRCNVKRCYQSLMDSDGREGLEGLARVVFTGSADRTATFDSSS